MSKFAFCIFFFTQDSTLLQNTYRTAAKHKQKILGKNICQTTVAVNFALWSFQGYWPCEKYSHYLITLLNASKCLISLQHVKLPVFIILN